ncbi:MAG: ethanolamine utilization microcompartment protein EutL, partial [Deltaproteobacteria bacterium]|nr:ethanolamine utilization microcompartment protein EutL [Deltaproteobacteria bacterium]
LQLRPDQRCLGMITADIDDCLYAALDQGTKAAEVEVVYAKSFYAGAKHASGPLSGEIIGMLAAADMDTLTEGLAATVRYLRDEAWFWSAHARNALAYFPHVIAATGSYLSAQAGIERGAPLAYLIAPPLEAVLGIDAALKAAEVRLARFYPPPSETNFAGGLLAGDLPACRAAAAAFARTVLDVAVNPIDFDYRGRLEEVVGPAPERTAPAPGAGPYRLWGSGLALPHKPDGYTHLVDNASLVPKDHPSMRLRGKLDLLQAEVLAAQLTAREQQRSELEQELGQVLDFLRRLLGAEVTGRPCPELEVAGFTGDELRTISHATARHLGVGFVQPSAAMGPLVVALNRLRAQSRELELTALQAFAADDGRLGERFCGQAQHELNRLSSALHVLVCRELARR